MQTAGRTTDEATHRDPKIDALHLSLLDDRSTRILAKTIYRELRESGAAERDVLAIATELLGLVASDLRERG